MNKEKKYIISQPDAIHVVNFREIIYCKSDSCYTTVYLANGKNYVLVRSLAKVAKDDLNDEQFIRVNQSYLINKNHIQMIDKKKKLIAMIQDHFIPFTISLKALLALIIDI